VIFKCFSCVLLCFKRDIRLHLDICAYILLNKDGKSYIQ